MEPSGPVSLVDLLDADLALNDDDGVMSLEDWPSSPHHGRHSALVPGAEAAPPSPVPPLATLHHAQQAPSSRAAPLLLAPPPPAFAPRDAYIKLLFRDNPSVAIKLRWLSEVNGAFHLDRDQAGVKMAAITSRFVYISRHRPDIVTSVTKGEFLSLPLEIQDSPDKPRKFPTYLLTRYPVCSDPALAKELPGVYSARRFYQKGSAINRLVVTWSLPQPPPPSVAFSFLPSLPSCEFRRMKDEQPWCFRCWGFGHISRYCFAAERCAWCSGPHDSRSCPHRAPPPAAPASDSASTPPQVSPPDTSLWECPRCHQAGVNVWHGCARRQTVAAPAATTIPQLAPPPPPLRSAPHPALPTTLVSPQVTALSNTVAALQSRIASLEAAIDGGEARLDRLAKQRATLNASLQTVAESQKVIIASVATFAEKMDVFAARFESLPATVAPRAPPSCGARATPFVRTSPPARAAAASSPGRRTLRGRVR
ncbi:hypothetical protein GWK47_027083 [Chionoecetes opilio]|uniref:Uncharacterized protein n=1 Tax=Chionoecetes opilio TaxID=41210 RepID=A0A8J8W9S2_CHIOP|nr:hypothetical protein GWK47_027083 [Chionoecetes opilio]